MTELDAPEPLLGVKLHRPTLPDDCVHRHALLSRLQGGDNRSLTLICAPAGYGKSSLAIDWLEHSEHPSCWLSLDQSDGDLKIFLRYIINALKLQFPGICSDLLSRIDAPSLPSVSSLNTIFSNALEAVEHRIILALDDYHLVGDPDIHEFVNNLLEYPSRTLRLALISRRNPPLSLASLRASNQINEIRMSDLRFGESTEFLARSTKNPLDTAAVTQIHNSTEGGAATSCACTTSSNRFIKPATSV